MRLRGACGWQDQMESVVQRSRIACHRLDRGLWAWREGCHRGEYANVLLAAKGPCVSSAPQALQIAISSVARAVWCGSGVIVDGKTEWSGAEVADSLVWIAACEYGRSAVFYGFWRRVHRDEMTLQGSCRGLPVSWPI